MTTGYEDAVAAWADHLRHGGTSTWSAWLASAGEQGPGAGPGAGPEARPESGPLPDGLHLELVRRLNAAAGRPVPALADLVLVTAAPGRGLLDVPLPWPAPTRTARFGTPARNPEDLPVEELVRLAVGVLARLLPGLARQPDEHAGAPRWPLPWRTRFRLHGSPGTVAATRTRLLAAGLVESDWRATHVVLARPLDVMMAEEWAARTRSGGILKWSTLWRRAVAADRPPASVDVARTATSLHGRGERVHLVVARDPAEIAAEVARALGARRSPAPGEPTRAPEPDLAGTDLLRRANRLLGLTAGPQRVRALSDVLTARVLPPSDPAMGAATWPGVPLPARAWATATAAAMAEEVRHAGYAVHGDPEDIVPVHDPRLSGTVDRERTLGLALDACLRAWQLQGGS